MDHEWREWAVGQGRAITYPRDTPSPPPPQPPTGSSGLSVADLSCTQIPESTECSPNAGLLLGQRRRRWTGIKPAFGQCLVLDGNETLTGQSTSSTDPDVDPVLF